MRAYQVFAFMTAERAAQMMRVLAEQAPEAYEQALVAAGASLNLRPVYLKRQPLDRQASTVRRAMCRVGSNAAAEELLAVYFLECRKELLLEWLDAIGLEHEDGALTDQAPEQPAERKLRSSVEKFRSAGPDADRDLLLRAFASQTAIEWPTLDALLEG